MSKNILFVGFMGVGKGTVARALVSKTGLFGVDTDDLIESMENRKIKDIFLDNGEKYFRELEQKTAMWLRKNVKKSIISTGGGFYKVKNLEKIGTIIYLESSFDGILKRLKAHPNGEKKLKKRPLLSDIKKAKKLFNERIAQYEKKADITINVENKNLNKIIKEILQEIK